MLDTEAFARVFESDADTETVATLDRLALASVFARLADTVVAAELAREASDSVDASSASCGVKNVCCVPLR